MIQLKAPTPPLDARIDLPVSKSILNRLLIIRYLAEGKIEAIASSSSTPDDCHIMHRALTDLLHGRSIIDAEDAGTVMRFICAAACLEEREILITGSERMQQRPIKPLVDALRQLGADIRYEQQEGFPPVRIMPTLPKGGTATISGGISSQFISALLMIAPRLDMGLELIIEGHRVSTPYVDMTTQLLNQHEVQYEVKTEHIKITRQDMRLSDISAESDWSAAAFWYGLVALSKGGKVLLKGLKLYSKQGDCALADLFLPLGVSSRETENGVLIYQEGQATSFLKEDCTGFPDLAQALAFTCAGLEIGCELNGLGTLPSKETDRIAAIKEELGKLGLQVNCTSDSLSFNPTKLAVNQVIFESYKDHRMVMAESIMCMRMKVSINDYEAVSKSYPTYFDEMEKAGFGIRI